MSDRTAELLAKLADGCAALETSEGWQRSGGNPI